ncbi:MAG: amidohydrolase family protein [Sphingobium sp.]
MSIRIISANCHLIEPPHVFEGRMPRRFENQAPRLEDYPGGGLQWRFGDEVRPLHKSCAVAGMEPEEWVKSSIVGHKDIRLGCYDPVARLADMDLDGVYAAACLSSPAGVGFGGDLFFHTQDEELGLAAMRAWNDWYHEEWVGVAPDRFIPVGCTSYRNPHAAAAEVRRNALRGFKGVAFRNPTDLDQPWVGTGYWDPFFDACQETGTVIFHHTNNLAWWPRPPAGAPGSAVAASERAYPYGMVTTLFQSSAMEMLNAWLWGGVGVRFPRLRVLIAESGGSWLPHLLRRLDWAIGFSELHRRGWPSQQSPVEMIRQNYAFSTLEPDVAADVTERYGIDNWMLESDYPHMESVWPDSQAHYARELAGFTPARTEDITWRNAARLFRHPVPPGWHDAAPEAAPPQAVA